MSIHATHPSGDGTGVCGSGIWGHTWTGSSTGRGGLGSRVCMHMSRQGRGSEVCSREDSGKTVGNGLRVNACWRSGGKRLQWGEDPGGGMCNGRG